MEPTDETPSDPTPRPNHRAQRRVAAYRHVAAHVGGTVVDLGCGDGVGLPILRGAGARGVIGVDDDEATVRATRAAHASDSIEVVEGELADLPLVVDTMDAVVAVHVVERAPDLAGMLAEVARITRPGGTVAVVTPNRLAWSPGSTTPTNPFHRREFTPDELQHALEDAGIDVTTMTGIRHTARVADLLAPHVAGRPLAILDDLSAGGGDLGPLLDALVPDDFVVTEADVESSLDLLAWGRA